MFQQLYAAYQETGDKIYRFAAEEILRLRAENEKFYKQAEMNARLLTENASLRAEHKMAFEAVGDVVKANDDLRAENEKLRAALKPFAEKRVNSDWEDCEGVNIWVSTGELRAAKIAMIEGNADE